jgi:hypothetical protein
MPIPFGLMIDFIPIRHRGLIAAVVAGLAFLVAALTSTGPTHLA